MNFKIGILFFLFCGLAACDKDDCEEMVEEEDIVVVQNCNDNVLNDQETDIDCGGPSCGPCSNETCYLDYYVNGEFYQSNFVSILLQGNETGSAITLSGGLAHSFALFLDSSTGDSLEIGDYEVEVGTAVVTSTCVLVANDGSTYTAQDSDEGLVFQLTTVDFPDPFVLFSQGWLEGLFSGTMYNSVTGENVVITEGAFGCAFTP